MQNFQEIIRHASHLKQSQLKQSRQQFQSLPSFLKSGMSYSKKYYRLRSQDFYVRMFTSDNLKRQGNQFIKDNKVQEALQKYEEALSIFRYIQTRTNQNVKDTDLTYFIYSSKDGQEDTYRKHMVSLYLNISLCLTKLNKKQESVRSVQQAIQIDPSNPKCFYRLGQAYIKYINRSQHDVQQGIKWLQKAMEVTKDIEIQKEIQRVRREVQKQNQKSKKAFSFMINSNLRDSTHSQKEAVREKKKQCPEGKKQKSRSMQKKPVKTFEAAPKIKDVQKTSASNVSISHAQQQSKSLLIEKQLQQIEEKQNQKRKKMQQKLLKIANKQNWEVYLLENFIVTKGRKIQTLIQFYGYKQYITQFRTLLNKCLLLHDKTNKKCEKFIDQEGEEITLNFQEKQTKKVVIQQKLKIYSQYLKWLQDHPIPQVRKYLQRYLNHKQFIQQKIQSRLLESQSMSWEFNNKIQQNRKSSMKALYAGVVVILLWILYRRFFI